MKSAILLLILTAWFGTLPLATAQEPSPLPLEGKIFPCDLTPAIEYILNCYGANQENTHKLVPVSKIIETGCKIEKLGMLFDYYGSLDIPKARALAIQAVTELLQIVNSSNKLTPYLINRGLTPDDIIIRIRWRSPACGFFYPPLGNVVFVSAMENKIVYDTLNSYTYTLNNLMTETFQEGLRRNK